MSSIPLVERVSESTKRDDYVSIGIGPNIPVNFGFVPAATFPYRDEKFECERFDREQVTKARSTLWR